MERRARDACETHQRRISHGSPHRRFTDMNHAHNRQVWCDCQTPIGRLTLTATDAGLDGLFFPGRAPELDAADHRPKRFAQAVEQIDEYFAGTRNRFELELDLSRGTAFQQSVWTELRQISYGETVSYSELAARLGRTDRVRAVGAAVGRTPVPIIVPCHRVLAADGSLTGYLGGLERKRRLLDLEAAVSQGRQLPASVEPRQLALI